MSDPYTPESGSHDAGLAFERGLRRAFESAPLLADNEMFVSRVNRRLTVHWAFRRSSMVLVGFAAGLVLCWQFLSSQLEPGAVASLMDVAPPVWSGSILPPMSALSTLSDAMGLISAGPLWIALLTCGLGIAFVIGRLIDEI